MTCCLPILNLHKYDIYCVLFTSWRLKFVLISVSQPKNSLKVTNNWKINLRHTSMVLGSGGLPGSDRRQETVVSTKSLWSSVPEQGLWKYVFPIEDTTSTTYSISWGWAKRTNGFVGKLELSCTGFIFCFNIDYKDNFDKFDKLYWIIKNF